MLPTDFANDIPLDTARQAHQGTSFDPEKRAEMERAGYAATLAADYINLYHYADTDAKREQLAVEFARYRTGYRRRVLVMLGAKSRCLSTMIAGPSNFNTRRAEKSSNSADNKTRDVIEFRERALSAIRKTLCPELRPIMTGDDNATERLDAKIAKLEKTQEIMKAANAAIRANAKAGPEAQIAALVTLGLPESRARDLLKPDFAGRIGFPAYELTNNSANIRRLKARLGHVAEVHATPSTEIEGTNARLEDVPAENRVRLFFPGKPIEAVRTRLKSCGFRWTPSTGCWQAYRNHNSLTLAREIAGVPAEAVAS